jgi:hypothetical protein
MFSSFKNSFKFACISVVFGGGSACLINESYMVGYEEIVTSRVVRRIKPRIRIIENTINIHGSSISNLLNNMPKRKEDNKNKTSVY